MIEGRCSVKKGFTLIELLAVIVILAVIALIVTPIVLSTIDDTENSAMIRSSEFYVNAVENKIMQENMKSGGELNPKECIINSDGNVTCDGIDLEVEVNGDKSRGGVITFQSGKLLKVEIEFETVKIVKNLVGEYVNYDEDIICKSLPAGTSTIGNIPENNFLPGDAYKCEVKNGVEYNFFVISKDGDNIPDIEVNYQDPTGKYGGIKTSGDTTKIYMIDEIITATYKNLKARLPYFYTDTTKTEVSAYDETNRYLFDNLNGSVTGVNTSSSYPTRYWTMASRQNSTSTTTVHTIGADGSIGNNYASARNGFGVRPVISIPKSIIY